MRRFEGKNVIVTGGTSGIGLATAEAFRREGAHVVVLDQSSGCDVTDPVQVENAMAHLTSIDVLFNNAGIAARRTIEEENPESWDRTMAVNVKGVYLCSKYALPRMNAGSSIIHTSSVVGLTGTRNRAAYSATKGAIIALTRNMALDLAPRGIRVNCVCPGFVRTPLIAALQDDSERLARITALHPLGQLGDPEDVAHLVLFLASEEARWITGQAIAVDGGYTAGHADDI